MKETSEDVSRTMIYNNSKWRKKLDLKIQKLSIKSDYYTAAKMICVKIVSDNRKTFKE